MKVSHEYHDLDVDYYFRCQSLEDEPNVCVIQSSEVVGRVCDQCHRFNGFNVFQTSSIDCKINCDYEDISFHPTLRNESYDLPSDLYSLCLLCANEENILPQFENDVLLPK